MSSNSDPVTLQTVIDDHIKARQAIYNDLTHPDKKNVSTALGTLFTPVNNANSNDNGANHTELRALIDTSLRELSPLARKTKYLEIQENFAKYYQQTEATNRQVSNTYTEALDKVNIALSKQHTDLKNLEYELESARRGESTHYRQMTMARFNLDKAKYYKQLYTVYIVVLILILVVISVLGKPVLGVIGRTTCILLVTVAIVVLAMYSIYYVYFKHPVRDVAMWRKYKWSANSPSGGNCQGNRRRSSIAAGANGLDAMSGTDDGVESRAIALAQSAHS